MTSLVKFLFVVLLLGGLGYGGLVALALFVEPGQREMVEPVPASRFEK